MGYWFDQTQEYAAERPMAVVETMRFPLDWSPEIEVLHDHLRSGEIARLNLLVRISDLDWQYQALESLSSLLIKTSRLRLWYEASPGEISGGDLGVRQAEGGRGGPRRAPRASAGLRVRRASGHIYCLPL